ncbi:SLC13 family permease [Wukongibacter sp. M2B1]|uniref:SLC13 family permease n=1 Tax=Wukongibacter sp. M2B1 TaxID=3088895 RepID=UPI003D7B141C
MITVKNREILITTLILPLIIFFLSKLSLNHKIILYSTVLVILWWTTSAIDRNISSIFLICIYFIFSNAPIKVILKFPMSSNFLMIVFIFLLSEGIVKSNLADYISKKLLVRIGDTPIKLIFLSFILGILLIFLIPQPFPRVILLSIIYSEFLSKQDINEDIRSTILFSIYAASTCTSMMFLNGDVLLNYLALQFGNVDFTWMEWLKYMTPPAIIICLLVFASFIALFRKSIPKTYFSFEGNVDESLVLNRKQKQTLVIVGIVLILFISQPIHSLKFEWITFLGVLLMFLMRILELKDIRSININLLIFLTAAFSISGVLKHIGTSELLSSQITRLLDHQDKTLFIISVIGIVMILHIFLGSAITTISVGLPILLSSKGFKIDPAVLTLISYVVVNMHYLLPFHHATIMIGFGQNQYSNLKVFKFGLVLTVLTFLSVIFILIPWWMFIGII